MFKNITIVGMVLMGAAEPAISDGVVGYDGYDCSARLAGIPDIPGGFSGVAGATIRLDESGKLTKTEGRWTFAGPKEWTTGANTWSYNNPEIALTFERPGLDLSVPLNPASLSLGVTTMMPPQPTDIVVTLDTGEERRVPHVTAEFMARSPTWKGRVGPTAIIKDAPFLAALGRAKAMTIEVFQADNTRIFRSMLSFKGAAAVPQIVQRLDAEAIAASKDYQHRCKRIEIDYLVVN